MGGLIGDANRATIKLASLFIKTVSKPLAASIKSQAKNHPKFKTVCINIAQVYHQVDMRLKGRFLDPPSDMAVRPLNDTRAVELGANFIGESIIFMVAVGTIFAEMYRTSRNSKIQKETVNDAISLLQEKVDALIIDSSKIQLNHEALVDEMKSIQAKLHRLIDYPSNPEPIDQITLTHLSKHDENE